jgi:glucose/mannose transport system substrate-binding protein
MTEHESTADDVSRRNILKTTGAAGAAGLTGLSGCLSSLTGGTATVELLHGWSGGDGKAAFDAMADGFRENSDTELDVKAIGGSGNTSLDTRISQRIKNGNPPSSWAEWPGANLTQFTDDDVLGDIEGDVWTDEVKDAYLEGPKAAAKVGGNFVAVPTNIHRINNLFYNKSVVESAGVDPASIDSPMALVDALETVESETDAVGYAHSLKGPWTSLQLFASVFIGQHGSGAYTKFIEGEGSKSKVAKSLEALAAYEEYMPDDASSISFQKAGTMVRKGDAAFMHQGDWLAGMFQGEGFEFEDGWGHVPYPGSEGVYQLNMDSWVFPADGPASEGAKEWLSYCATPEAQIAFNKQKGSIPPRGDVSMEEFPRFQTKQFEEFTASDSQPPSLAHGLAVPPKQQSSLEQALSNEFDFSSGSVDATATAFIDAVSN